MSDEPPPTSRRLVHRAAALLIGSELLSGKTRDENLLPLASTLRALGIELARVIVCPDNIETIRDDIRELSKEFDIVVTSGGVGPTHDDTTIEGVCQGLGLANVPSQQLRELLMGHYGDKLQEAHLAMAQIPEGARLLFGGDIRWPLVVAENVWIFPGVPELFRMKLAALREHLRGPELFYSEVVFVNAEETTIKNVLDELVALHPGVEIGSYPKWFDPRYKTRLTFDSRNANTVKQAAEDASQRLAAHVVIVT